MAPPSAGEEADRPPDPPADPGVLAALGTAVAIDGRFLGPGMRLEVLPVEVAPAVTCTVRLTREDGGAIGPGRASRRAPNGPAVDAAGAWSTGPGAAWTGPVPGGETVYLHFPAPNGEKRAPYGWFVDLSAAPVDGGHVRLRVDGSAPI